ncbi:HDOD domain-containing protein [Clostridium beijerinckii]|uniref:Stage 0 sporulation protein A homolog n=1 Tax=Clostridium beijerinckii TaxID=1520 RepID=A0A1S8S239_CLOBE|nr:HDOD domain-containing protein [Clostridium beijerinckii]NRY63737.1 HD-like signal output (HDOD) protein [Clostridium beijerinckii]OOM59504.1 hydrogenase transcriptional regulatory protein hupR1 [Clostridium beijerinckii]
MSKSILFVDDEKSILNSIRREFFDSPYDVYIANGGREALDILEKNHIDLIVSDMRMPEMDGYELLKRVKLLYPEVTRLILSGFTDEKTVFKSIYNNLAKLFITKPWKKDDFRRAIDEVFKTEELLHNNISLNHIKEMGKLPTIPSVLQEISDVVEHDDHNIDRIVRLIEADITLSSEVLRIINSAFYGIKTASIKTAVLSLGLVNLKAIMATAEVFKSGNDFYNKNEIWEHSNLTNKILIELYNKALGKKIPDYYGTAGLLHDIGKVAFFKIYDKEYDDIYKLAADKSLGEISTLEKEKFKIDHEELGGYLLQWWDIPYAIVESALYHHNPMLSSDANRELVSMIYIADYYSWHIINPNYKPKLYLEVFDNYGISEERCEQIVKNLVERKN